MEEVKTIIDDIRQKYRESIVKAYARGKADGIEESVDKFADIMSNMKQICGRSCPVNCNWGTEENCKDICKKWLIEQLRGKEVDV